MPNFSDGAVRYGSKVLSIGTPAQTYVADDFKVSRPTAKIERRDEKNRPSGKVYVEDFISGDATLQLATGATTTPKRGDTFSITLETQYGEETFVISDVDNTFEKGSETKVPIKFDLVIAAITIEA